MCKEAGTYDIEPSTWVRIPCDLERRGNVAWPDLCQKRRTSQRSVIIESLVYNIPRKNLAFVVSHDYHTN